MLKDSEQRLQATDPSRSFIVQAPAGSGKTELLTQRYLRLLSTVEAPEQIIALTFTRKAASEMHERIVLALTRAANKIPPASSHQQITQDYATAALKQSERFNWQIIEQPSRLKIMTIDALCQSLTRSIPLYEQDLPYADISDNPGELYREAAKVSIRYLLEQKQMHEPLTLILQHLDNRQDRLEDLLSNLLASRQLWVAPLGLAREQEKSHYENALAEIEAHQLKRLYRHLPSTCLETLRELASMVAECELQEVSPRYGLKHWRDVKDFDRKIANGLASLLLTLEGKFRKSFDHHVGFTLERAGNKALFEDVKSRSKRLLEELSSQEELRFLLQQIRSLPSPEYEEDQWQVLQALLTVLPLVLAHLQLQFQQSNSIDFTAITDQAIAALGEDEAPTDLALYLDNRLSHLLIDEYQDTSIQQDKLIAKLVQGWLADEGKTLFLVGDPMQSIYRFRQAEVGLFLKAKEQGIAELRLIPIQLVCNFRSTPSLIEWINKQFQALFPSVNDIEAGAVSFHPSVAAREEDASSAVIARVYSSKEEEAEAIADIVEKELNETDKTIAILVRSRQLLSQIIPLLRKKGISFQGTDIEKLGQLAHVQDVWCLAKALLLPADRLSWLAFLRSPWVGLNLSDLHCLANVDKKKSIFIALEQAQVLEQLSAEGRLRCLFVYSLMKQALENRQQQSLIETLAELMSQLQAQHILTAEDQNDVEALFLLLTERIQKGETLDIQQLDDELSGRYITRASSSRLQIMTIHKAKGLEFDSVILPGLGAKPANQDRPLFRWLKLLTSEGKETILLSPVQAAEEGSCPLYDYLGAINKEKELYEQQRLFYVAATRAKKTLYLLDHHEKPENNSFRQSLGQVEFCPQEEKPEASLAGTSPMLLSRLPNSCYEKALEPAVHSPSQALPPLINQSPSYARLLGVISHELLQWICSHHPLSAADLPWEIVAQRFKEQGLDNSITEEALAQLRLQITGLFSNPKGQWICQKHLQENNEYALLVNEEGKTCTKIIDRTFCEGAHRWIIDFKTGKETELAHRQQVNEYARLLALTDSKAIRCGLFYLATGDWVEWAFEPVDA